MQGKPKDSSIKLIRRVADRPGHDRRYAIDSSKLQKELGWKPRFVFEEALYDVIKWYIKHKNWADAVRSGGYLNFHEQQYKER